MNMQRRTVCFSGRVQGVGFRFTAIRIAERYDITGYVRNLHDGKVECVIEGSPDTLDEFITDLSGAMSGYISETTQQLSTYTGALGPFTVKY